MKHGFRVVVRLHSRLGRFISGSAVAHVAFAVVALILPMTRQRPVPVDDTMTVSLAGPIGGGASAPAPRAELPKPEAKAAPAPKEAHTVREVPVPKPKDKPTPVKPKKDPAPPKETAPPSDATPEADPDAAPAAGDAKASNPDSKGPGPAVPGAPSGITASVGGGDSALGWYGAAVKAALESAWAKPFLEDQGETYSVVIAFDIARDGSTHNVRIVTSSGIPSLDRSAQRAVIEASPLPAVPPAWDGDTLPATMRFDLSPESR